MDDFVDIVTGIFDACMRTGYNPRHFQSSITVTLRKGGPRDFRKPKSYRPVALLNTLGKILEINHRNTHRVGGRRIQDSTEKAPRWT